MPWRIHKEGQTSHTSSALTPKLSSDAMVSRDDFPVRSCLITLSYRFLQYKLLLLTVKCRGMSNEDFDTTWTWYVDLRLGFDFGLILLEASEQDFT